MRLSKKFKYYMQDHKRWALVVSQHGGRVTYNASDKMSNPCGSCDTTLARFRQLYPFSQAEVDNAKA